MKTKIFTQLFLILFFISACRSSDKNTAAPKVSGKTDIASHFENLNGCFLLYNLKTGKWDETYNKERCKERQAACSTFKIPLAIMGFESEALKNEITLFKWDGKKRSIETWNKDQTAGTWMKESVVWYSQKLTPKIGKKEIQTYLNDFEYGNKDFSGDITNAWLTPSPLLESSPPKTSVLISGYGQIDFLKKLWLGKLPVSPHSMDLTKKIMFLETSSNGYTLHGKTGSGYTGTDFKQRLGWFVAHIEGHGQEYLAVVNFHDKEPSASTSPAGPQAKQIMKDILAAKGLF